MMGTSRAAALWVPAAAAVVTCLGCGEGGDFALSAGAPVTAAVEGSITRCGTPVSGAAVVLHVQQTEPMQARPVDTRLGPVTTDGGGGYLIEVAPAFAVPGSAEVRLLVTPAGGAAVEFPGATLELALGEPPRDTLHLDADLGVAAGVCR